MDAGEMEPSAEKTIVDLSCAANGGELWRVEVNYKPANRRKKEVKSVAARIAELPYAHPTYLEAVVRGEVLECTNCHVDVPGVLTLPCGCETELLCPAML